MTAILAQGRDKPRSAAPGGGVRGVPARRHRRGRADIGRRLREAWSWLTGTGYRPERHYMRGGRPAVAATRLAAATTRCGAMLAAIGSAAPVGAGLRPATTGTVP